MKFIFLASLFAVFLAPMISTANPNKKRKSLLNNDPDVLYLEEYSAKPIEFLAAEDAPGYANKKGGQKLTTFKKGSKLVLIAMTDKAYRVIGKGKYGKVRAWVDPKKLASKDPKFVENLKKLYERQMAVNAMIANKEVAIGMTLDEVSQSLGEPTKKETKITKDGRVGKWEFINYVKQKHYHYVRNPVNGQIYRQLSHVTTEEKGKISVEFENDIITSITSKESEGPSKVKIINPPIIFGF